MEEIHVCHAPSQLRCLLTASSLFHVLIISVISDVFPSLPYILSPILRHEVFYPFSSSSVIHAVFLSLSIPCSDNLSSVTTVSLIPLDPPFPCLPDSYSDPTMPWIIMPCGMSLCTRQRKSSEADFESFNSPILTNLIAQHMPASMSISAWLVSSQVLACLFLTSYPLWSHRMIIHPSKGKVLSTGMDPASQELRPIQKQD